MTGQTVWLKRGTQLDHVLEYLVHMTYYTFHPKNIVPLGYVFNFHESEKLLIYI